MWLYLLVFLMIIGYIHISKMSVEIPTEKFSPIVVNKEERITSDIFDGICSPKCCMQNQWPVDFMETGTSLDFSIYEKTNLHCKGCSGSGCLCVPKKI